jgi:Rrf2 family protein
LVIPASSATSVAAATPAIPSWSVSDITVTPASTAARATAAGSSWPSETVEWAWRSITRPRDGSGGGTATRIVDLRCENQVMRISAKADYAVRAALELAASPDGEPVKGEQLAESQNIPLQFLEHILLELKHARLIQARRGAKGGYWLARDPASITVADVIRAVEGPLANIHENAPEELHYGGPATKLRDVWVAVRAGLRSVLENVTLADVAEDNLPWRIDAILNDPEAWIKR